MNPKFAKTSAAWRMNYLGIDPNSSLTPFLDGFVAIGIVVDSERKPISQ